MVSSRTATVLQSESKAVLGLSSQSLVSKNMALDYEFILKIINDRSVLISVLLLPLSSTCVLTGKDLRGVFG